MIRPATEHRLSGSGTSPDRLPRHRDAQQWAGERHSHHDCAPAGYQDMTPEESAIDWYSVGAYVVILSTAVAVVAALLNGL